MSRHKHGFDLGFGLGDTIPWYKHGLHAIGLSSMELVSKAHIVLCGLSPEGGSN